MFSSLVKTWSHGVLGHHSIVTVECPKEENILLTSKVMRPPINLKLILDVSGSMYSNMKHVLNTALASVDMIDNGCKLTIVTFDDNVQNIVSQILSEETRGDVKLKIKSEVLNRSGSTNIELALLNAFSEPCSILFMTDGYANLGTAQTSKQLIELARALPYYSQCIVNTLGIHDESTLINSDLLKQLAFDTNGTYRLTKDAESLASFLGDTLAGHYLKRGNCKIAVKSLNGNVGTIVSPPLQGFVVRADRPIKAVFTWPSNSFLPITATITINDSEPISTTKYDFADENDIVAIVGSLCVQEIDRKIIRKDFIDAVMQIAQKYTSLLPIALALYNPTATETRESIELSQKIYNFASLGGGEPSGCVQELQNASNSCSLTQNA